MLNRTESLGQSTIVNIPSVCSSGIKERACYTTTCRWGCAVRLRSLALSDTATEVPLYGGFKTRWVACLVIKTIDVV